MGSSPGIVNGFTASRLIERSCSPLAGNEEVPGGHTAGGIIFGLCSVLNPSESCDAT